MSCCGQSGGTAPAQNNKPEHVPAQAQARARARARAQALETEQSSEDE